MEVSRSHSSGSTSHNMQFYGDKSHLLYMCLPVNTYVLYDLLEAFHKCLRYASLTFILIKLGSSMNVTVTV